MNGRRTLKALTLTTCVLFASLLPLAAAVLLGGRIDVPGWILLLVGFMGFLLAWQIFSSLLGRHRYEILRKTLSIRSLGSSRVIRLADVTEVSKFKRIGRRGKRSEQIRVTYEKKGEICNAVLAPKDPGAFLHLLVSRCPQLTGYDQARVIRNGSPVGEAASADA